MRCLTLANALSDAGWRCGFACSPETAPVVPALQRSAHELFVLEDDPSDEPAALAKHWGAGIDLLIVDHYGRDAAFESVCRGWAKRIMVIDDTADRPHDCDILLDQTPGRAEADYEGLVPDDCRVLLGSAYALLRPEFARLRPEALERRKDGLAIGTVLVSMGAADPHNVAAMALEGLARSGLDVKVDVVAGAASPHLQSLRELTASLGLQVTIHEAADSMADLMARADLAIGAAGGTSWERCCLGLPSLVIATAANQEKIAAALDRAGAAISLGRRADVTPDTIADALRALRSDTARGCAAPGELCDGRGVARTLIALVEPRPARDAGLVRLRMARRNDRDRILSWQKDPRTRRFARTPDVPTAREHAKWFDRSLADADRYLMIVEHADAPAGVLRLDRLDRPDTYEVSIFIAPEKYRLGIGSAALSLARALVPGATLHADVLPENTGSLGLFRGAGYRQSDGTLYVSTPDGGGPAK